MAVEARPKLPQPAGRPVSTQSFVIDQQVPRVLVLHFRKGPVPPEEQPKKSDWVKGESEQVNICGSDQIATANRIRAILAFDHFDLAGQALPLLRDPANAKTKFSHAFPCLPAIRRRFDERYFR